MEMSVGVILVLEHMAKLMTMNVICLVAETTPSSAEVDIEI